MGRRLELHAKLKALLPTTGVELYFQPPSAMKYPCVKYEWDSEYVAHADNETHIKERRYLVTVIDRDIDSEIPDLIGSMNKSRFVRRFNSDGLVHTIYNLYY